MIALIDGDSIAYILGWTHKDNQDVPGMHAAIDSFLDDIFTMCGADMYFGALGSDSIKCWRYDLYKAKPYKGGRTDDEHMKFWKPIVKGYLKKSYNFQDSERREADDLIGLAAELCKKEGHDYIICSPDKDMRQLVGRHYDYRTQQFCDVDENDTNLNFYRIMIEGDATDNIMGIPGKGEKVTKDKLYPLHARRAPNAEFHTTVWDMYIRHFGPYYGELIFEETYSTVKINPPGYCTQDEPIEIHPVPQKENPFDAMNKPDLI